MKLIEKIIRKTSIGNVAEKLSLPLRKYGKYFFSDCPGGHPARPGLTFGFDPELNYYFCFSCGIGGNVIDLVKVVKSISFESAGRWLVENFHPELLLELDQFPMVEPPAKPEKYYLKAFLYELVYLRGKKLFYESEMGRKNLARLAAMKGLRTENIRNTEWIFIPLESELRSFLIQEYHDTQALVFGTPKKSFDDKIVLSGPGGDKFRIGFPYRDRHGLITGFVKRSTIRESRERWDFTRDINYADFFNIWRCAGNDSLLLLEGYSESMLLPVLGYSVFPCAAFGKEEFTESQINGLVDLGIKEVTLAFNNATDNEEKENQHKRIQSAAKLLGNSGITGYIFDSKALHPYKDPEDYLLGNKVYELPANTINDYEKLVKNNTFTFPIWTTRSKIQDWKKADPSKQKKIMFDLMDQRTKIKNIIELNEYDEEIKSVLHMTSQQYEDLQREQQLDRERQKLKKSYQSILKEGLRSRGSIEDLQEIKTKLDLLLGKFSWRQSFSPEVLSEKIKRKFMHEEVPTESSSLTLSASFFQKLLDQLGGLKHGLYLLAGTPGCGKSAFLIHLFLDLMLNNPHLSGLYISLEDNTEIILDRMLSCRMGFNYPDQKFNLNENQQEIRNTAYQELINWAKSDRLAIVDTSQVVSVVQLQDAISLAMHHVDFVIVDSVNSVLPDTSPDQKAISSDLGRMLKVQSSRMRIPIFVSCPLITSDEFFLGDEADGFYEAMTNSSSLIENSNLILSMYPDPDSSKTMVLNCIKNKISYKFFKQQYVLMTDLGFRFWEHDLTTESSTEQNSIWQIDSPPQQLIENHSNEAPPPGENENEIILEEETLLEQELSEQDNAEIESDTLDT